MSATNPTIFRTLQVKRFNNEVKLIRDQPLGYITAYQSKENHLIWYFLIVGQVGSDYEGGHFIGVIEHSPEYPSKGPMYSMLTPNGRFEPNRKICTSNSSFHPESWNSTWNIHTILIAFYSLFREDRDSGLGHIRMGKDERIAISRDSIRFNQASLGQIYDKFDFSVLSFDVDHDPRYNTGRYIPMPITSSTNMAIESETSSDSNSNA